MPKSEAEQGLDRIMRGHLNSELDIFHESARLHSFTPGNKCLIEADHTNWCALSVALAKRHQAKEGKPCLKK